MEYDEILNLITQTIDKEITNYINHPINYNILGKDINELIVSKIKGFEAITGKKTDLSFVLGHIQGMSQARDITKRAFVDEKREGTKFNKNLKLFCFQPKGHGEYSAFVMANSEEEARKFIDKAVVDHNKKYEAYENFEFEDDMEEEDIPEEVLYSIDIGKFNTGYYNVTVLGVGEVAFNANE